ncbi:MAG: hypothetical protein HOP29_11975 [Phycisphaerales bacterium]|nr:hypothetical protein [Phycisphaerales bacterium]
MQTGYFRFVRGRLLSFLTAVALVMTGCTPPPGDGNDNDPPPDETPIMVTIEGQGMVNQSVDGSQVTLTANPDTDWSFESWSGDVDSTDNPLVVDITEVNAVTATFILEEGPPRPVTDIDGDGVANDGDACPDTSAGAAVDAAGCAADQRDSDGDGVMDAGDDCADTPDGADVDANGCPDATADADGDGVNDAADQCPDTAADNQVDDDGCAPDQLDADGDKVPDNTDRCANTPAGTPVDRSGCPVTDPPPPPPPPGGNVPVCGNGTTETGEQCDPPTPGTCDANCQMVVVEMNNDECAGAEIASDALNSFNNSAATNSGPALTGACGTSNLGADIWFRHAASCTGILTVSTCASTFDTALAVYAGDACPTGQPTACSDDDCEFGTGSLVTVNVTTGQAFIIRVGGFSGANGDGTLIITCGDEPGGAVCGVDSSSCTAEHATPGCGDGDCCRAVCDFDRFCCESEWDDLCVEDAVAICQGTFNACLNNTESCTTERLTPGCSNQSCCETVCAADPFCCLERWDVMCVDAAAACR